jgi:hypothetical protein
MIAEVGISLCSPVVSTTTTIIIIIGNPGLPICRFVRRESR